MTGIWTMVGLCAAGVLAYAVYCLKRLGTPTKGKRIDRALRPVTALVVIDVQEDFTRNTGKHAFDPGEREAALAEISRQVEAHRLAGHQVAFIKNVFRDWPVVVAMKIAAGGIGTPGRDGLKLDRTLDVGSAAVFEKSIGDSFSSPQFEAWLEENRVGKLVLVGLDACHCVQLTAKGALARGYEVEIRDPATLTTRPDKWAELKGELSHLGAAFA
ncbi:cysteine hydrolase [Roseibium sp. FZY0029]|uniref:cysteine hydrolase family protein n=1 Tax=Roseibium sp. FZY0029 TaxID=3116647 RepID=UPI002E9E6E0C|nr:cysteine hydrolase [Roseibium sp. FZY0029]